MSGVLAAPIRSHFAVDPTGRDVKARRVGKMQ
jgi:hypothetical protein